LGQGLTTTPCGMAWMFGWVPFFHVIIDVTAGQVIKETFELKGLRESEVFNLPLILFNIRDIGFLAGFAGKLICSDFLI
jgi:hypothetical protein